MPTPAPRSQRAGRLPLPKRPSSRPARKAPTRCHAQARRALRAAEGGAPPGLARATNPANAAMGNASLAKLATQSSSASVRSIAVNVGLVRAVHGDAEIFGLRCVEPLELGPEFR